MKLTMEPRVQRLFVARPNLQLGINYRMLFQLLINESINQSIGLLPLFQF